MCNNDEEIMKLIEKNKLCCRPCFCPTGPQGVAGEASGILNYADFYALMPPDNSATVAPGTDVSFPHYWYGNCYYNSDKFNFNS